MNKTGKIALIISLFALAGAGYYLYSRRGKTTEPRTSPGAIPSGGLVSFNIGCICQKNPAVISLFDQYLAESKKATRPWLVANLRAQILDKCSCHPLSSQEITGSVSQEEHDLKLERARLVDRKATVQNKYNAQLSSLQSWKAKALECDRKRAQFSLGPRKNKVCSISNRDLFYRNWDNASKSLPRTAAEITAIQVKIDEIDFKLSNL